MLSAKASSTQVELFGLTLNYESNRVNIGHPAAFCVPLGMAHTMTKLRRLATYITLHYLVSVDCQKKLV